MSALKAIVPVLLFVVLNLTGSTAIAFESDWTVVQPAKDSRIIYVSSSSGRDNRGKVYDRDDIADLENPGKIRAFKTLHHAMTKMRPGYPDIMLLRRGDEWTIDKDIYLRGGRSPDEKMTVMAYGPGDRRPRINSVDTVFRIWGDASNVAIIGLYLYAYKRDPDSDYFAGWDSIGSPSGIQIYSDEGVMRSYLIEDNRINFFDGAITIVGKAKHEDIVIRRNVIQNSYNTTEHAQGMYAYNASLILEENVFDHNGWYQQRFPDGKDRSEGQATLFNHNAYFGDSYDTVFRNNLFLRASSQHNKWTSNPEGKVDSIKSWNLLIEDNFYYGGEIGIGIGGNTDFNTGFRWQNIVVRDNVLLAIGKNQPTRRDIGWYITLSDWNGGSVCGNYLLHNDNSRVTNLRAIEVKGHVSDLLLARNTITGLHMDKSYIAAITFDDFPKKNIRIEENRIQLPESRMRMIDSGRSYDGTFARNIYYGMADPNEWFIYGGAAYDIEKWRKLTGDASSRAARIKYTHPPRNLASYAKSLGLSGEEELFDRLAGQSRSNWDERLSAQSINAYLREGYGNLKCGLQ